MILVTQTYIILSLNLILDTQTYIILSLKFICQNRCQRRLLQTHGEQVCKKKLNTITFSEYPFVPFSLSLSFQPLNNGSKVPCLNQSGGLEDMITGVDVVTFGFVDALKFGDLGLRI